MIILTEEQKYLVLGKYGKFKELNPIEIKNNLYMLPEIIFNDNDFKDVFHVLTKCEIREVLKDELIQYEL